MDINDFTDEDLVEENPNEEISLVQEEPGDISLEEEEINDEIVVEDFLVENIPLEEIPIEPECPESLLDPKLQVYVPKATTYRPGIASYNNKHFMVDPKGKVSLIVDLNDIKEKTDTALENSQEALETSSEAKSIAEEALEQVIIGEGTKIYEDGVLQSSISVDKDIQEQFNDINELIPAQASSENQLADKEFVNSSIATNTANFIGTFADVPTLLAYSGTITNNDYAFVVNSERDFTSTTEMNAYNKGLLTNFDYAWIPNGSNYDLYRFDIVEQTWVLKVTDTAKADVTLNTAYNRYKAVIVGNTVSWVFEYTLNNSSFTADQWAAINSGITASGVTQISDLQTNKADKNNATQEIVAKKMTATVYKVSTAGNAVLDGTEWGLDAFNGSLRLVTNRSGTNMQLVVPQNQETQFYNGTTKVATVDKDGISANNLRVDGRIRTNYVVYYAQQFVRYGDASWIRVGRLSCEIPDRIFGGKIYTHQGYGTNENHAYICDFNMIIDNDYTIAGFMTMSMTTGATRTKPRLRFVKISDGVWDMHYWSPQWSNALITIDCSHDCTFVFDTNPENTSSPSADGAVTVEATINNTLYGSGNGGYYIKYPNGMMIQWGTLGSSNVLVTYPLAFINDNYSIVACANVDSNATGFAQAKKRSTQTAWIRVRTGSNVYTDSACWVAIGWWK